MAIHIPKKEVKEPCVADFSETVAIMWYIRKKTIAMTTGKPSPPFLMIAPRGAPIKNNNKQEAASVNFLYYSFWTLMMFFLRSSWSEILAEVVCMIELACSSAF